MSILFSVYSRNFHIFLLTGLVIGFFSLVFSTGSSACCGGGGGGGGGDRDFESASGPHKKNFGKRKRITRKKINRRIYRTSRKAKRRKLRRTPRKSRSTTNYNPRAWNSPFGWSHTNPASNVNRGQPQFGWSHMAPKHDWTNTYTGIQPGVTYTPVTPPATRQPPPPQASYTPSVPGLVTPEQMESLTPSQRLTVERILKDYEEARRNPNKHFVEGFTKGFRKSDSVLPETNQSRTSISQATGSPGTTRLNPFDMPEARQPWDRPPSNPEIMPGVRGVLDKGFGIIGDIKDLIPNAITDAKTVADLAQASSDMTNATTDKEYYEAVDKYMKTSVKAIGGIIGKTVAAGAAPTTGFWSVMGIPAGGQIGSEFAGGLYDIITNTDVKREEKPVYGTGPMLPGDAGGLSGL